MELSTANGLVTVSIAIGKLHHASDLLTLSIDAPDTFVMISVTDDAGECFVDRGSLHNL